MSRMYVAVTLITFHDFIQTDSNFILNYQAANNNKEYKIYNVIHCPPPFSFHCLCAKSGKIQETKICPK